MKNATELVATLTSFQLSGTIFRTMIFIIFVWQLLNANQHLPFMSFQQLTNTSPWHLAFWLKLSRRMKEKPKRSTNNGNLLIRIKWWTARWKNWLKQKGHYPYSYVSDRSTFLETTYHPSKIGVTLSKVAQFQLMKQNWNMNKKCGGLFTVVLFKTITMGIWNWTVHCWHASASFIESWVSKHTSWIVCTFILYQTWPRRRHCEFVKLKLNFWPSVSIWIS